jgi:hypothetical protein
MLFLLRDKIGEWVPSEVMEARLLWLVEKGLLSSKEVARWWAATRDVFLFPQPSEVVSFLDFHEPRFMILASDSSMDSSVSTVSNCSTFLLTRCCSWQASSLSARPS